MDKIHHIALQVSDIKEAVNWYKKRFNVKVLYQDNSWGYLEFENVKLAFVLPEQHPNHIAFERTDAEKFGELTPHRDGTASIYIKDPFGNFLEMLKEKGR